MEREARFSHTFKAGKEQGGRGKTTTDKGAHTFKNGRKQEGELGAYSFYAPSPFLGDSHPLNISSPL